MLALEHNDDSKDKSLFDKRAKPVSGNGHALSLKDLSVQLPMKFRPSGVTQNKLDAHLQLGPQHALT